MIFLMGRSRELPTEQACEGVKGSGPVEATMRESFQGEGIPQQELLAERGTKSAGLVRGQPGERRVGRQAGARRC